MAYGEWKGKPQPGEERSTARERDKDRRQGYEKWVLLLGGATSLTAGIRQKFQTLLEDLFEAADSLPADPDPDFLARNSFFDRLASDSRTPLLASRVVEKISRYITRLNSSKRTQSVETFAWDEDGLKRVFQFLERSIREAEGVDPFPSDRKGAEIKKKAVKKSKKGKVESGGADQDEDSLDSNTTTNALSETELDRCEAKLRVVADCIRAVECCLTILDSDGLSKPVRSQRQSSIFNS